MLLTLRTSLLLIMQYELMFKIRLEMLLSFKIQPSPVGGPSLVVIATVSSGYHVHRFCVKVSLFSITLILHTPTQRVALASLGPPQGSMRDLERRKDSRADYSNK